MNRYAIIVYVFFVALFGVFCYFANCHNYFPNDVAVSQWLQKIDFSGAKPIMQFLPYALLLGVIIALRPWRKENWRPVAFTAGATLAAWAATWVIKLAVERPRPDIELVAVMEGKLGSGFPSGHFVCAVVLGGFLIYLMPRLVKSTTAIWCWRVLLIVIIVFVGVSRIYLGVHWLSDIYGGLVLGGLILYPTIVIYRKYEVNNA